MYGLEVGISMNSELFSCLGLGMHPGQPFLTKLYINIHQYSSFSKYSLSNTIRVSNGLIPDQDIQNYQCQTVWIQMRTDRIIRVSNGLDPDQDRHSVCPDMSPNCLQRLSADDKKHTYKY